MQKQTIKDEEIKEAEDEDADGTPERYSRDVDESDDDAEDNNPTEMVFKEILEEAYSFKSYPDVH